MVDMNLLYATLFGLAYNVTLNLSKGVQKWGIEGLSVDTLKQWKQRPELKKKFYAWGIGSIGTIVAVVFQVVAQFFTDKSSYIAAFGGIGLMCLVIFSYYALHEQIKTPEKVGCVVVVVATLLFGITVEAPTPSTGIDYTLLIVVSVITLGILFLLGFISVRHGYKGHAVIWGAIAGYFSGLGIALSQTAVTSGGRTVTGTLLTPDVWIALLTGVAAFSFTQYGFMHGHASVVVTLYNTLALIVPVIVDLFVLNRVISIFPLLMLACIGVGVVLLTAFREDASFMMGEKKADDQETREEST
jgi:drug/metabolite transporter (DMT)-like permease